MSEFEQGIEIPEQFVIDTDRKADWAVEKVLEAYAERDRLLALYKEKVDELTAAANSIKEKAEKQTGYLKGLLYEYFQTVKVAETKTQRKYKLLAGTLVQKKQQPIYEQNEQEMVAWAKVSAPEFVEVKEKIMWGELKKKATVSGGDVLYEGEVIPGVKAVERPDTFEVIA